MAHFVSERCWKCDVEYQITATLQARRIEDGESIWCPNGHSGAYKNSTMDQLRRERDLLTQRIAQKDDEIARQRDRREAAERQASAARGQVTKLKRRAAAGLCPCCNRHFTNLERHMATQHPDDVKDAGLRVVAGGKP